ncbi:MAG: hypothetical protein ACXWR4_15605, partial [Bdellovibrionota bacterium]
MRFLLAQNSVLLLGALLLLEPTAAKAAEYCSPEEMSGIAARRAAAARAHDPNPGAVAGRERDVERFLQRATPTPATATIRANVKPKLHSCFIGHSSGRGPSSLSIDSSVSIRT